MGDSGNARHNQLLTSALSEMQRGNEARRGPAALRDRSFTVA
jgi:hypothetical protein